MSQPYVGEIRIFGFNFTVSGWQLCDGSILSIQNNETLFNLIGTTYGGDGINTFAVPDLRGRVPIHQGSSILIGQSGGAENVTLTSGQVATHTHGIVADGNPGGASNGVGGYFAGTTVNVYGLPSNGVSGVILQANSGGSQPHTNVQPYLTINYSISLFGVFPSQS